LKSQLIELAFFVLYRSLLI